MERDPITLTPSERQVMEALWRGPKTLMELVRELNDSAGWAKSTVTTMVRRMEGKKLITHRVKERAKVFRPAVTREEVALGETETLLRRVYNGSVGLMVSTMVQGKHLTKEDIEELYEILRQAEGEEL